MPISINLDTAMIKWQFAHNEGMTYTELARRAGIPLSTLNRIKSGEITNPDLRKINMLCKVLECEPGDLFVRTTTKALEEVHNPDANEEIEQLISDIEQAGAEAEEEEDFGSADEQTINEVGGS